MPTLDHVRRMLADEHGLAVVSTVQADGRVLSSVVNCGVVRDPISEVTVVGFVSHGAAARNAHVRRGSQVTVTVRRDWRWVGVTGPARMIGPDDRTDGFDEERTRLLLRDVFRAAGGTHDDWVEYDRVMLADRRVAVLVEPVRVVGNLG
jgi:PPOX class probable F420-dependent enzyme